MKRNSWLIISQTTHTHETKKENKDTIKRRKERPSTASNNKQARITKDYRRLHISRRVYFERSKLAQKAVGKFAQSAGNYLILRLFEPDKVFICREFKLELNKIKTQKFAIH